MATPIPALSHAGVRTQLLVDGKPLILLGAEIDNSGSSSLAFMQRNWTKLVKLHANAAYAPISWELVEPREGHYDFTLVDGLIKGAREHGLRLIFLWFGTWKNSFSTYTPEWVKVDWKRFPHAQPKPGERWGAITAFSRAAQAADARAFAAVMRRIRQVDQAHTVVMIQVENETGLLGGARDHSPQAEAAWSQPVPRELMSYLTGHRETLLPELADPWKAAGARTEGSWQEVFGPVADEVFMAWHIGRYVDGVAAAGKAEYPLPMFVNAWLEGEPGSYPDGGPVSRMMDIWRAAAPHLDLFAPDIYGDTRRFAEMCARYSRSGNPLVIDECSPEYAPATAFVAIAGNDALVYGPYPLEAPFDGPGLGDDYEFFRNIMPLLTEAQRTGRVRCILQRDADSQEDDLGGFRVHVTFNKREAGKLPAHGLVLALNDHDYLIAGVGFQVGFSPRPGTWKYAEVISVDEGRYENGRWIPGRRLNGDEAGVKLEAREAGYSGQAQPLQIRRVHVDGLND